MPSDKPTKMPGKLLSFQANLYALPDGCQPGPTVTLRGCELATIAGEANGPPRFLDTLPVTFEAMQAELMELPRSDCEPDGFFLITGGQKETFWRVNGHMHEFEGRMHRIELSGQCPAEALDPILKTMGWPEVTLAFELVQEGVTLRESDFRTWAAAENKPSAGVGDDPALEGSHNVRAGSSPTPALLQEQTPSRATTPWHITFGTYGTRLHGDNRPTVDREHNQIGAPFVAANQGRRIHEQQRMRFSAVRFSQAQREFIEQAIPSICERGGWQLHACAAEVDRVHLVCEIPIEIHGEKARRLIKRWLTQALDEQWPLKAGARWWAEQGSNKAIKDASYLRNAIAYVDRKRATRK